MQNWQGEVQTNAHRNKELALILRSPRLLGWATNWALNGYSLALQIVRTEFPYDCFVLKQAAYCAVHTPSFELYWRQTSYPWKRIDRCKQFLVRTRQGGTVSICRVLYLFTYIRVFICHRQNWSYIMEEYTLSCVVTPPKVGKIRKNKVSHLVYCPPPTCYTP